MKAKEVEGAVQLLIKVDLKQAQQIAALKKEIKALKKAQRKVNYPSTAYD